MADRDRVTPIEAHRAAKPPRPASASLSADDPQAVRDAESLERRRQEALRRKPPPLPARAQERKTTPQSGGIVAPGSPTASPAPIPVTISDSEPPPSKAPTSKDWAKLRFSLASKVAAAIAGSMVLVIAAVGFYLVTTINAAAEAKKANKKADVVKTATDEQAPRVAALEAYIRADAERDKCVEAQLRDALARGTGHVLLSLPDDPVAWAEQNKPKAQARTIWPVPTWFTTKVCPVKPAAP